jgi:hypothetical protein
MSDRPAVLRGFHALYSSFWPYFMTVAGIVVAVACVVERRPLLAFGGLCASAWGLTDLAVRFGRGGHATRRAGIVCGTLTLLIFLADLCARWYALLRPGR